MPTLSQPFLLSKIIYTSVDYFIMYCCTCYCRGKVPSQLCFEQFTKIQNISLCSAVLPLKLTFSLSLRSLATLSTLYKMTLMYEGL